MDVPHVPIPLVPLEVSPRPRPAQRLLRAGTLLGVVGVAVLLVYFAFDTAALWLDGGPRELARLNVARGIAAAVVASLVTAWQLARAHATERAQLESVVAEARESVSEAQAVLATVLATTPASVLVLDEAWQIVHANQRAQRVHKGRSLAGQRCYVALAERDRVCEQCPALGVRQTGESHEGPHPHVDPRTGEVLKVHSYALPLAHGRQYTLLVEEIITEQQRLQARLLHQEKMAAFGLLAAGIAHDLGNPIAAVDLQLQRLRGLSLSQPVASALKLVSTEMARLQRTLRELVGLARRRREGLSLVDVQSVVDAAVRLVRHDPRARAVAFTLSRDPGTPPVRMVEDHLVQIVLNVIFNALDAMPEGGALTIECTSVGETVVLRIHDTGIGMDRTTLERSCEPLFTTKPPGKGTGLGLSICHDLVSAIGGRLELHSRPGAGTSVIVTLPAASRRANATPVRDSAPDAAQDARRPRADSSDAEPVPASAVARAKPVRSGLPGSRGCTTPRA